MKKLPKAITRTARDMRQAGGLAAAAEMADASSHAPTLVEPVVTRAAAARTGAAATDVMNGHAAAASGMSPSDAAWRHRRAQAIVERYAAYSAVGGMIPVPLVNAAGITASIVRMVKVLSRHYGVPFEHDRARAIVVGLAMGVFPSGLGALTSSTLVSIVPGANVIGLVTSSLVAAGCTRTIGQIFLEHFENGATLADFPVIGKR